MKKIFLFVFLVACTQRESHLQINWTKDSGLPVPTQLQDPSFKKNEISLLVSGEVVERAKQSVGPAEIEGTYLQKIYGQDGEITHILGSVNTTSLDHLLPTINEAHLKRFAILHGLKRRDRELSEASHIFDPKVVIAQMLGKPEVVYHIDYFDKENTQAYRLIVSLDQGIVGRELVGGKFESASGKVFPIGPKWSDLQNVIFNELIGDGSLSKPTLKVSSQSGEQAKSLDRTFDYDPQDRKFDQVQVFFFIDRTLDFFAKQLGVTIPFPLDVQIDVGHPQKTNAMFYYHGNIRLGVGDNITYENILKDPSIVTHETSHALIDALSGLPFEGEGGTINEGMADYFTAAHLSNAKMGETSCIQCAYRRTVDNQLTLDNKTGKRHTDCGIVSGTFWEIQSLLGKEKTLELARDTLTRLGPGGNYKNFPAAIQSASEKINVEGRLQINQVLSKRKWL